MATLKFLALEQTELALLQQLGKVILSNYRQEPSTEPEPTIQEFENLAALFARIMEL